MLPPARNSIPPEGRWLRLGLAVAILLVLLCLALQRSDRRLSFLTCGFHAISGLPCLFCGGTRAARAILHGNLHAALYFNALAFPALAIVAGAFVALLVEAAAGRPLALREILLRHLNRFVPALLLLALAWWIFHIYTALRTPKPELVDFQNPIAAGARAIVERGGH
jgi:Protein of unknown function (DUF2752)